jgi:hypothetical protein
VRVGGVIAVHAVFDEQLPVRSHRIFELAVSEFHVAEVERVVENRQRVAHVAFKAFDLWIEADKDAAAVVVHPRRRLEAKRVAIEGLAVSLLSGYAFEFAARTVDPAVVEAAEEFGAGAFRFTADQIAAMAARVHQDADFAVIAVRQDDRPPGHRARHEIAAVGKFREVAGEQPALVENPRPLLLEDLLIDKSAAVDAENAVFPIVEYQPSGVTPVSHRSFLLRRTVSAAETAA